MVEAIVAAASCRQAGIGAGQPPSSLGAELGRPRDGGGGGGQSHVDGGDPHGGGGLGTCVRVQSATGGVALQLGAGGGGASASAEAVGVRVPVALPSYVLRAKRN